MHEEISMKTQHLKSSVNKHYGTQYSDLLHQKLFAVCKSIKSWSRHQCNVFSGYSASITPGDDHPK